MAEQDATRGSLGLVGRTSSGRGVLMRGICRTLGLAEVMRLLDLRPTPPLDDKGARELIEHRYLAVHVRCGETGEPPLVSYQTADSVEELTRQRAGWQRVCVADLDEPAHLVINEAGEVTGRMPLRIILSDGRTDDSGETPAES